MAHQQRIRDSRGSEDLRQQLRFVVHVAHRARLAQQAGYDGVTEQWFHSVDDFFASLQEDDYHLIEEDIAKFIDDAGFATLPQSCLDYLATSKRPPLFASLLGPR